ncbi:potassium transporter TrkA [Boudabousia liubingyangii]|uniref:Trk system potassium uptake protein TrkA n=1 Tax=Boudabousia liubingyangii TaxID=1921764 RepID=A0A1Q5PJC3_9ACTO|nr:TrkA family potassium uptake protein [Boudabousia liubingyangii]OKL45985.1 potassium transporter TrkA [Boudabousia liubingyangii]OKL47738.1 potassium transporter TrkA [Boudabousia liubingyangii]
MKIVIAGAGSVGRSIARELLSHSHEVTLIDKNPSKLRVASVAEADWILADACSPDALEDAGLQTADVIVAATGDDKANLVISLLAKSEFAVPRVVARVNNYVNEWMFDATWGVDVPVSTPRLMTGLVEEAVTRGKPVRIFTFNEARVDLFAAVLGERSLMINERIGDLALPPGVVLSALLRDGKPIAPNPDGVIVEGDELLFLVPRSNPELLAQVTRLVEDPVQEEVPSDSEKTSEED